MAVKIKVKKPARKESAPSLGPVGTGEVESDNETQQLVFRYAKLKAEVEELKKRPGTVRRRRGRERELPAGGHSERPLRRDGQLQDRLGFQDHELR